MAEDRFDRIERWQSKADARFDRIDDWQSTADARFERLEQRLSQLDDNMHVLHEDVMSRLKAMPEQVVPTRSEMMDGFAEIKEMIGRRLDPLEAVVKQDTKDIQRLKETGR